MTRPSRTGGKTSEAKARNANPAKSRKTTKTKRGIAPAATRVKRRSVSGLSKDLKEVREQQAATVEILKAIASSPSDTTPVFEAIASSAKRLLGGYSAAVFRYIDDNVHLAAFTPTKPAADEALKADFPTPVEQFVAFRLAQHGKPFPISDTEEVSHAPVTAIARLHGFRSMLWVPMVNGDVTIGVICVTRVEPGAFAPPHTQLLQTFANQAVIAIENTRLFNETREALERQTATAEILKVIASSPSDVQPVFDAIAASANRLLGGFSSTVFRFIDGMAHLKAFTPTTPEADEILQSTFPRPVGNFAPFRMTQAGEVMQIPDTEAPTYGLKEIARARGYRSMLYAPLMNKGVSIGFIAVTRVQPGTFADHQVQLLRTFADQAVIAIENARLFDEVQAKTRDLSESLQQQTATSDVLKVIASSPTDVEPALQAIVESACALCDAYDANVLLKIGDDLEFSAHHGPIPTGQYPRPINRQWVTGRSVVDRVPVQVSDFQAPEAAEFPEGQRQSREQGHRCTLSVPLLREGEAIGAIVLRRLEPVAFNEKQTALLQTFADQAVIAIENARLFNETKEALERQTATADILKVIASSPSDVQPVFDAIAERSKRLVDALSTTVFRLVDGMMHLTAFTSTSPEADATLRAIFPAPLLTFSWGESILRGEIYRVTDSEHEPEGLRDLARRRGWRSCLCVPLLRDGKPIGMIGPTRAEPGPFADHHVQLLQTFADQAVIAISNVQLFQQVQERTSELSASLDDLRATQDRLVQTEKLASLGQLTAGIAHEIKNPLNFVNNFSALSAELTDELKEVLMQERLTDKGREELDELTRLLKDNLGKVVQHGKRADSIVKNMLLHSREGSGERRSADINALVGESLNLAYHGARAEKASFNITLKHDLDPEAGAVDLYPQEITRALLNLISNGFYAATRRKAETVDETFEPVLSATTRGLGETVEIRIRDNGTGISAEVREKIFNPFFTTKPTGEGTGLGLSMTHDIIVKQHGGSIDVETEPGSFTEFIITLPR